MVDSVTFCKALGDGTRQRILDLLREKDELRVGDIVDVFEMSQPTISHHLAILKQASLVTSRKEGKQVLYSIDHQNVIECCGKLFARLDFCQTSPTRRRPRSKTKRGSNGRT